MIFSLSKKYEFLSLFLGLPIAGLFLLGSFTASAQSPPMPRKSPETIILISLDTTRADHLSCYGYEHETTPNIDALAEESLFFEQPFAPVPLTHPTHSSIFTGVIPPTHGVHVNLSTNLSESAVTFPELLNEAGYATYGIVSTVVLKSDGGLNQGFDHYDDSMGDDDGEIDLHAERRGDETTARALNWLDDNAEKKKFMFIHYYDAHAFYEPPAPFDTEFENPYDGEIAFQDHCVGQILDRLKALDLYDDALIVLVGDHGELLGEHDEAEHSYFIYQNVLRVPLMFKLPGATQTKKIADPCSVIDIAPTLLSLTGLPVPEPMQGIDLTAYLRPDFSQPDRAIYSESMTPTSYNCSSLLGILKGRWHYIQSTRPELYDRIEDPVEMNNLVEEFPERASEMKEQLRDILAEAERSDAGDAAELDGELLEQLAALGYVETGASVDYSFEEGKKDAKDVINVRNQIFDAKRMRGAGQMEEAIEAFLVIIEDHPDIPNTYDALTSAYIGRNELENAITMLKKKTTVFPDDHTGLMYLAGMYEVTKNVTKQVETLNQMIALKADDSMAYKTLINIYMRQRAIDKALAAQLEMHKVIPPDATTLMTLGIIYIEKNDVTRALTSFLDVLDLDPRSINARTNAAGLYLEMRRPDQALALCEEGLAIGTDAPHLRGLIARIKMTPDFKQLYDERSALEHAQVALELSKEETGQEPTRNLADAYQTLAMAWLANNDYDKAISAAQSAIELYTAKGLTDLANRMRGMIGMIENLR
jgi:arylsulfatase A-like enzyme